MAKRDYYEVLGVSRDAAQDQIKKSYRQLAVKFHPDKNPGDKESEERFKEASEAYQILSDAESRRKYDQFGHAAFSGGGGFEGFGDFNGFAEEIFGDLFGAFFGNAQQGRRQSRAGKRGGRDLRFGVEITLEEAAFGIEKEINLPKPIPCNECDGSGCRKGTSPESCRACGGSGQSTVRQGFFTLSRPCGSCNGQGKIIVTPCGQCTGTGSRTEEKKLTVKIPAGINEGQSLKLRSEGEPGVQGNPAGDLYLEVSIKQHDVFRRQETELLCEVTLPYSIATLGGEIKVPTLEGAISMKIPPGTQSGTTFRLRGKGIVEMQSGRRGDQHVRTMIVVPTAITDRQRELLQELAEIDGIAANDENRTFLDKVKEFFE